MSPARFLVRYVCAIGAMQSAAAIPRVVPVTHCGPGCADKQYMNVAFYNGFQSSGYGGGPVAPSTNASQREVIFGGADRLRELIGASLKVLDADLSSCRRAAETGRTGQARPRHRFQLIATRFSAPR